MNAELTVCCLCLRASTNLSHFLCDDNKKRISYYEKLTTSFPQLIFDGKYNDYMLCPKCCQTVNLVYEFSKNCITNLKSFIEYKVELAGKGDKKPGSSEIPTQFVKCELTQTDKNRLENDKSKTDSNDVSIVNVKIEPDDDEVIVETQQTSCDNEPSVCGDLKSQGIHVKTEDISDETVHSVFSTQNADADNQDDEDTTFNFSQANKNNMFYVHNLTKQLQNHASGYMCDICNKVLSTENRLIIHKQTHTNTKLYGCDICNKTFAYPSLLIKHKEIHTDEKSYVCDICNKGFNILSNLKKHTRIHFDIKPFICDICNKGFNQNVNLIRHRRIHTGEKPFECELCNKAFLDQSSLIRHKHTHTGMKPHVCDVCNKGFSLPSDLVKHKRTHTGEKPYECDVCFKQFNVSSLLFRHQRANHMGEKPFPCDTCDMRFSQKTNLVRHQQMHANHMLEPTTETSTSTEHQLK